MKRWASLFLLLIAGSVGPAYGQARSEEEIKAAFVMKFGAYVDWPTSGSGPFIICMVGDGGLGGALARAAKGQQVAGRPIYVRRLARLDRRSGCSLAVVAGSTTQQRAAALAAVAGAPVLTVTDGSRGGARGMIHFEVVGSRVGFHIDDQAAAEAGLSISSKLLAIALSVRSRMAR